MGSLVDYDKHYVKGPGQCGEPFPEFIAFFDALPARSLRVLDLGCGQGRDALLLARRGHEVVGVDLSDVGLKQLESEAKRERLAIDVCLSDVADFRTRRRFDVVLLDRVLHLMLSDDERVAVLDNACRHVRKRGAILIADGAKHMPLIRAFFDERPEWKALKKSKRFFFVTRPKRFGFGEERR